MFIVEALKGMGVGFGYMMDPVTILLIMGSVVLGSFVGAVPGLGSKIALTMIIPFTGHLAPYVALALYLSVSEASSFGDTIPAVLFKVPGTEGSAATAIDGYAMTQNGRPGFALGAASMASLLGGMIGICVSILFIPFLADYVLLFGPPEFFWMAIIGISIIAVVSHGTMAKGILSGLIGILISFIGTDVITGKERFTFGTMYLSDGINFIPAMLGLFAVTEMLKISRKTTKLEMIATVNSRREIWEGCMVCFKYPVNMIRSSLIGIIVGAIPGTGKSVASFLSYLFAVRGSKHPETFGKGEIEGIIAPEFANNACSGGGGALIPTLTLGIPGSSGMALILVGMTFLGIRSGPAFIIQHADMMYAMFAGLIIGMIFAFGLNFFCIKPIAKAVQVSNETLIPVVFVFAFLGSFALRNSLFDMLITVIFGILGYYMDKYDYSPVCMVLAMILGPLAGESFFQAWMIGNRSLTVFFTRPVSLGLFLFLIVIMAGPYVYQKIKGHYSRLTV
ncbi:MAG: tripartite tricarboxylate transporter permease [Deltaproteobacteria bacterium]|nr:tripartite tricarboxylate transporter permease [Deltaproteobacteria bacterium]